jgi:hypothetical protein
LLIAHAFGVRYDLPLPLWLFILAAALAVFGSFVYVADRAVSPPSKGFAADSDAMAGRGGGLARSLVSLLVLTGLIYCGLTGSQAIAENILPTTFWLLIWIAVPISCGLLGDWASRWNPYGVVARLADRPALRQRLLHGPELRWPRLLGWWPAAAVFFFIAGGELIYNQKAVEPLWTAIGLLVYATITAFGAFLFGSKTWLQYGEVFSVLYATWGRLGWRRFGREGNGGLLGGLDEPVSASVSRITFVLLMLGSVTFDGLLATPTWKSLMAPLPLRDQPGTARYTVFAVFAFISLILVLWGFFLICASAVRRAGRLVTSTRQSLAILLPSMLPIAFAYLIAHNMDYLFVNGQLLIPLIGDPTGHHQWLPAPFNDNYVIDKKILPPALIWYLAVAVIVGAHIAAVIVAHRHLRWASATPEESKRAEWPWIAAMVLYTMSSLWLLAQPIAKETTHTTLGVTGVVASLSPSKSNSADDQEEQSHGRQHCPDDDAGGGRSAQT